MANFDAARYLCQWSRLAKVIGGSMAVAAPQRSSTGGRFVAFDKSHRKEHGLFFYRDENLGVQYQLPLIGPGPNATSDNLAFPHCPGIFDWTVNQIPTSDDSRAYLWQRCDRSFLLRKNCVTGIGLKKSLYLRFNQPELVRTDGSFANGIGQCQVQWTFGNGKVSSEFVFQVKTPSPWTVCV